MSFIVTIITTIASICKAIPALTNFGDSLLKYAKKIQLRKHEQAASDRKVVKDHDVDAAINGLPIANAEIGQQQTLDTKK